MITISPTTLYIVGGAVLLILGVLIGALVRSGPSGAGGASISFTGLRELVEGYKTGILVVSAIATRFAQRKGWLDWETASEILEFLIGGGALTILAKFNRLEKKQTVAVENAQDAAATATQVAAEVRKIPKVAAPVTPTSVQAVRTDIPIKEG